MSIPKVQPKPLWKFQSERFPSKCSICCRTVPMGEWLIIDYIVEYGGLYCLECGEEIAEDEGREIKERSR